MSGSYDEYLPGDGLLVWHVDEAMNVYGKQNDYECTSVPHCQCSRSATTTCWPWNRPTASCDLERNMDGGDTGDPFPGNTTNRTWTMLTNPESSSWYGGAECTNTCIGVTNISDSGAAMTADLRVTCGPMPGNWAYLPLVVKNYGAK